MFSFQLQELLLTETICYFKNKVNNQGEVTAYSTEFNNHERTLQVRQLYKSIPTI
jgi:hypothetical protein